MLVSPAFANAQSFELHGSAGPTITDAGNSFAAGVGLSPTSRLTLSFDFERTHLASRTSRDGNTLSTFRGGTLLLGTAELRYALFGRDRFGPYGLAGLAAGVSHPNVNEMFPTRVSNQVRAMFVGGGVQVPLRERLAVFVDARMMFGAEGIEGIVAVAPVRAGVAWRF
jgi:hypothetical protein